MALRVNGTAPPLSTAMGSDLMSRINYLAKGTLNVLKRVLPPLLAVGGAVAIVAVPVTVSNLIN